MISEIGKVLSDEVAIAACMREAINRDTAGDKSMTDFWLQQAADLEKRGGENVNKRVQR
jgi:hypothetical protein